jgi:hypothetical protein
MTVAVIFAGAAAGAGAAIAASGLNAAAIGTIAAGAHRGSCADRPQQQ